MATTDTLKRLALGRPLRSDLQGDQELPKWVALPVFCSDPLSSVAYATEAILAILALGGLAFYSDAKWLAAVVVFLILVVVASYRQTIYAYPNGGGAYNVSKDNLGRGASLTAAAALLVDYVMTVTVSVAAGVTAITSAAPSLLPHAVGLSVFFVVLLMLVNLRGIKESGRTFAVPTYGFVVLVYVMFAWAAARLALTDTPFLASTADLQVRADHLVHTGGLATVFLLLRAFANGCTALTGVEAVSNGIPAFRRPKSKNAAQTLVTMGALSVTMFGGITYLALRAHVHAAEDPAVLGLSQAPPSALSQIAATTFGGSSIGFYLVQAFTAGILVLAANTAFNGFPVLASILASDGFLPRQLRNRGDRLVFSNGIVALAVFAVALLIGFSADVNRLLQLYIIGVFLSFTLSQAGMVRHWQRALLSAEPAGRQRIRRSQLVNVIGAAFTAVVLVVVLVTKFVEGAWIAITAMVVIFLLMQGVHRHYARISRELARPAVGMAAMTLPSRVHAVVLVSKIHAPTLRAVAYARVTHPHTLEAVTVAVDAAEATALTTEWETVGLAAKVPLRVLSSPYRDVTKPVLDYVAGLRRQSPRDIVVVYVPEYVVGHWWEQLLHNQTPLRIKARLLFQPGVMVTSVPWQLESSSRRGHGPHTPSPGATLRREAAEAAQAMAAADAPGEEPEPAAR